MAIKGKEEREYEKKVIDLQSPQGNAFFLLGTAESLARKLMLDPDEVQKEMTSDDYEHLIKTFDKYFGELVDLQK